MLGVSLIFCAILSLAWGMVINTTVDKPVDIKVADVSVKRPSTQCQRQSRNTPKIYGWCPPQCDPDYVWNYRPQQCCGSTGYCWCVDIFSGEEIPGTITGPGQNPDDCYKTLTKCQYERSYTPNIIGACPPQCDPDGNYKPQQCCGSTGYCWCVDIYSGEKIPGTITPPGQTPVDCEPCDPGWSRYGRQCFSFVNARVPWNMAQKYCKTNLAKLTSVHSAEENDFVHGLTEYVPRTFIGGYTMDDNDWRWIDRTSFNYTNWCQGPVIKGSIIPACLEMRDSKCWSGASCSATLPFVCAKNVP